MAVLKSKVFSLERAHEGLLGIIEGLQDHIAVRDARIKALTAEVEEQARLLGASGSREAELLARVEALEKAARALHNRIISLSRDYDADDCHIINEAIVIDIMLLGGEESDLAALLQEPSE